MLRIALHVFNKDAPSTFWEMGVRCWDSLDLNWNPQKRILCTPTENTCESFGRTKAAPVLDSTADPSSLSASLKPACCQTQRKKELNLFARSVIEEEGKGGGGKRMKEDREVSPVTRTWLATVIEGKCKLALGNPLMRMSPLRATSSSEFETKPNAAANTGGLIGD